MKTRNILPILTVASVLIASCQGGTAKKTQAKIDSTIVNNAATSSDSITCYAAIQNRDTAMLSITKSGDKVSGSLSYNLYEKDKNQGTISGMVRGDTILADYTFQSEGKTSVREVVWLKQGDKLIEGFGDVQEVGGKMKFKNTGKLSFQNSMVFTKRNCQ